MLYDFVIVIHPAPLSSRLRWIFFIRQHKSGGMRTGAPPPSRRGVSCLLGGGSLEPVEEVLAILGRSLGVPVVLDRLAEAATFGVVC